MTEVKLKNVAEAIEAIAERDHVSTYFLADMVGHAIRILGEGILDKGIEPAIKMACELEAWAEVCRHARLAMARDGDGTLAYGVRVMDGPKRVPEMYSCVIAIRDRELAAQVLQAMGTLVNHDISAEIAEWE